MNKRLAKVLELEARDLEKLDPASARAMQSHVLRYMPRDRYNEMWKAQNGCCAICGLPQQRKALAIDHCHTTGKVRGLLCAKCNTGIGLLGDTLESLQRAVKYLEEHENNVARSHARARILDDLTIYRKHFD